MKKFLLAVTIVLVVIFGILAFVKQNAAPAKSGPNDIAYIVQNQSYQLSNGLAENAVEGSSVKDVMRVFGEPVYGDLDGDGDMDAAVMLQSQPGGSGTFYYAVLAIDVNGTYASTNALLLGDRIAPQTVEIHDGRAVYNYADRKTDEPMSARPSVGVSLFVNYDKETGTISAEN